MAKRTAKMLANFAVLATIALFFGGMIFAGQPNIAFAEDTTASTTANAIESDLVSLVPATSTVVILSDTASSTATTSINIFGGATSTDENATSTATTTVIIDNGSTSTDATTTPFATSTNPFATSTDGTSTSTGATTTDATSTNPFATTTDQVATTTGTTTDIIGGGSGNGSNANATSTGTSTDLTLASTTKMMLTASSTEATTTATTSQAWRVDYYLYDMSRTDMAGWGIPFDEIQGFDPGDPLSNAFGADWFSRTYLKKTETQNGLEFGYEFIPFTHSTPPLTDPEGYLIGDNFGAHFMGLATVETEGDYTYTYTSDGDVWFYVDRVLDTRIRSGIKDPETKSRTIHMVPGQTYVLNLFFTERIAIFPYFNFHFPGVKITPCDDDRCVPPCLDPDTTGPSTPTIIDSSHAVGATSTNQEVFVRWSTSTDPVIPGAITSGFAGYVYLWDNSSTTIPGNDITSTDQALTLPLGKGTWWFHIKALDRAGNVSGVTHYGPIIIGDDGGCTGDCGNGDHTPPTQPVIISSTHLPNIESTDQFENIIWSSSTDPIVDGETTSGLAGYSFLWDNSSTTDPNDTIDEDIYTAFTTNLGVGTWWFHVKAIDKAGNVSATTHYGPIVIRATSTCTTPDCGTCTGPNCGTCTGPNCGTCTGPNCGTCTGPNCGTCTGGNCPPPPPPGGGGGGSCLPGWPCSNTGGTTTPPTVLGTSTVSTFGGEKSCPPYLTKYIKLGANNDRDQVIRLQVFLKYIEGHDDVQVTGFYDLVTYNAVKEFQKKYRDVLDSWGIAEPTGYVYITTSLKINYIVCGIKDRINLNLDPPAEGVSATSSVLGTSTAQEATSTQGFLRNVFVSSLGFLWDYLWIWLPALVILLTILFWDRLAGKKDDVQNTPVPTPSSNQTEDVPPINLPIAGDETKEEDSNANEVTPDDNR